MLPLHHPPALPGGTQIDIYSASWGPDDDGKRFEGPGVLAKAAMQRGVEHGRGGLGNIYVWASGNGGKHVRPLLGFLCRPANPHVLPRPRPADLLWPVQDDCNADGYTNNRHTLAVSSVTNDGESPYFAEACAAVFVSFNPSVPLAQLSLPFRRLPLQPPRWPQAVTYSSGGSGGAAVSTSDLHQGCTTHFTGTSASAPLAAGQLALVLQANPCLSWRDMQHIVVETATFSSLVDNKGDFSTNGAGRRFSHHLGFGLMDTEAMVAKARSWTRVADAFPIVMGPREVHRTSSTEIRDTVELSGCKEGGELCITKAEHVVVYIEASARRRGLLQIKLMSPSGTIAQLLTPRSLDYNSTGLKDWDFVGACGWVQVAMREGATGTEHGGAWGGGFWLPLRTLHEKR